MSTIWIIDDDDSIRWVLSRALTSAGHETEEFNSADGIIERLANQKPDAFITDVRMPGLSGLDLLDQIQQHAPELPVIIITAHSDLDSAVAAYQRGAFEYLPKPFDIDEALALVERAVDTRKRQHDTLEKSQSDDHALIGEAPAMQGVFRAIGRLSHSDVNVLIWGESGTGKELVARALHQHSPRAKAEFVALNMAAIPTELMESELFGHEKGSFTGAVAQRIGRFEQAAGGTLFLDEIGDMPAELQTRLLRVLSDKTFYRVGGRNEICTEVRIIAASNQNLLQRVEQGEFREDLYHRLNVVRINLPALRQRREDVATLTKHFLRNSADELAVEHKHINDEALDHLSSLDWPGNVRQLENTCRWLTVMVPGDVITISDLPDDLEPTATATAHSDWQQTLRQQVAREFRLGKTNVLKSLGQEFETILLEEALKQTGGHKQEAANLIGWGRNTLTRKLKELRPKSR